MCEVMGRSVPEARGQGGPDAGPMAGPPVAGTGGRRRGGAVARGHSRNVVNDAARAPRGSLRAAAAGGVLATSRSSAPSAAPARRSPVAGVGAAQCAKILQEGLAAAPADQAAHECPALSQQRHQQQQRQWPGTGSGYCLRQLPFAVCRSAQLLHGDAACHQGF